MGPIRNPADASANMATQTITPELPCVDERLVMPESGYEIIGGQVVVVSPAHEPHGSRHAKLAALLGAHPGSAYNVAIDMLTRTSATDDFAPDASLYPLARDPETGGRQLEALAFEVVSTETLAHAGKKAARLLGRGVRRVFAIDVERLRGLEWSQTTDAWEILASDATIEDRALAVPLPFRELLAVANADDAVARALLAKRNPILVAALQDHMLRGKAESIVSILVARGVPLADLERDTLLATRDAPTLERWLARVATGANADELLRA